MKITNALTVDFEVGTRVLKSLIRIGPATKTESFPRAAGC